jgi:hypothetical protein
MRIRYLGDADVNIFSFKKLKKHEREIHERAGIVDQHHKRRKHKHFDDIYLELYYHAQNQAEFQDPGNAQQFINSCKRVRERGLKWGWLAKAGQFLNVLCGCSLTLGRRYPDLIIVGGGSIPLLPQPSPPS